MSKPTPGPWEAHGANVFAGKNCIAICDTDNDTQERMEANARLIAASPTLYDYVAKKAAEGDADAARIIASI